MNNRLIEKWAAMWPRAVCDLPSEKENRLYIRTFKRPGIYILYREDIPYYVGKSKDLARKSHKK